MGVRVTSARVPPSFQLSGTGTQAQLEVWGPYADLAALQQPTRNGPQYAWRVRAMGKEVLEKPPQDFPPIQYGVLPAGWRRISESEPNAPPLQPGKFYRVSGGALQSPGPRPFPEASDYRNAELCFQVEGGAIKEVPCRP